MKTPGPAVQGTQQQFAPGRVDEGAQVLLQFGLAAGGQAVAGEGQQDMPVWKRPLWGKGLFELKALRKTADA